jgi:hypothetical protein
MERDLIRHSGANVRESERGQEREERTGSEATNQQRSRDEEDDCQRDQVDQKARGEDGTAD